MNRVRLINSIIQKGNFKRYLEIGTRSGTSLYAIGCKNKIAIDPNFIIPKTEKLKRKIFDLKNGRKTHYFEMTSDDFFERKKSFIKTFGNIDIALVDGMHTYHQALKDVLNILPFMNEKSVIVMHDCFPVSEPSSTAYNSEEFLAKEKHPDWTGEWNGDTWKSILYLLKKYPMDLDVFVLDTDYGLGIVQKKHNLPLNVELDTDLFRQFIPYTYQDLKKNPEELIHLKPKDIIPSFINRFHY